LTRAIPFSDDAWRDQVTPGFFIVQFLSLFPGFGRPPEASPAVSGSILPLIEIAGYQAGGAAADLDGVVGAAVPGIDLRHGSEVQSGERSANVRDVAGVMDGRDGLGVGLAEQPHLFDPGALEAGIDAGEGGREAVEEFPVGEAEVVVLRRQVIAAVDQVVAAEVLGRDEVGVLAQGQEGEAGLLGQVVPVVAVRAERLGERQRIVQVAATAGRVARNRKTISAPRRAPCP
jgi:hypothetical protein